MFFHVFVSLLLNLLEESSKVIPLEHQEFLLFFALCLIGSRALHITLFLRFNALLDLYDFVLLALLFGLKLLDLILKINFAMLSL